MFFIMRYFYTLTLTLKLIINSLNTVSTAYNKKICLADKRFQISNLELIKDIERIRGFINNMSIQSILSF